MNMPISTSFCHVHTVLLHVLQLGKSGEMKPCTTYFEEAYAACNQVGTGSWDRRGKQFCNANKAVAAEVGTERL
jgi:hypothetical protein